MIYARFNEKYDKSNIAQSTIFGVEVYIHVYSKAKGNVMIRLLKQVFTFAEMSIYFELGFNL